MSYFSNGIIYIIIPDVQITQEMINNMKTSFNSTTSTCGHTLSSATIQKTLFKVKAPVNSAFEGYTWYNNETIKAALVGPDWPDEEIFDG